MLPGKTYRPEDLLLIAWRGKWIVAATFVVLTAATAVGSAWLPNLYKSETLILVVPQRVPESYVRSTVTMRIEDRLPSLEQEIRSRSRLERVILDLNLFEEERRTALMEDVVKRVNNGITIETVRGDAFRVAYISHDPQVAKEVTERLASLFIEENVRDRELLAEGTSEFLQSQLDAARTQLVGQEKKLETYSLRHAGELPSQAASNVQAIQTIRLQLQAIAESINRDRDRQLVLERQLMELSGATPAGAPRAEAGESEPPAVQLESARHLLRSFEGRYTSDHPDVIRQRRIVARLERLVAEDGGRTTAAPPPDAATTRRRDLLRLEMGNLERQLTQKHADEKRLQQEMAAYQQRLEAVPIRESELIELTRDYETLQDLYQTLLAKREDSKVAANLERRQVGEQFRILDPARVPERPYSPNRPLLIALAAVLGLVVGLGLLALREYRDSSFKTEEEIRAHLSLQVIASIPDIAPSRSRWSSWKRTA
jgi:polysaccharide chain length determinant protein (PEP-CTERM system associated)